MFFSFLLSSLDSPSLSLHVFVFETFFFVALNEC